MHLEETIGIVRYGVSAFVHSSQVSDVRRSIALFFLNAFRSSKQLTRHSFSERKLPTTPLDAHRMTLEHVNQSVTELLRAGENIQKSHSYRWKTSTSWTLYASG